MRDVLRAGAAPCARRGRCRLDRDDCEIDALFDRVAACRRCSPTADRSSARQTRSRGSAANSPGASESLAASRSYNEDLQEPCASRRNTTTSLLPRSSARNQELVTAHAALVAVHAKLAASARASWPDPAAPDRTLAPYGLPRNFAIGPQLYDSGFVGPGVARTLGHECYN